MPEPTRRLPDPIVTPDGKLVGRSTLTPEAMTTRGAIAVPSRKVIPVIVVPGIMGSNLRVTTNRKSNIPDELHYGDPAWTPPNSKIAAALEVRLWNGRTASQRQLILDGDYLEVDGGGAIDLPRGSDGMDAEVMRSRGWGEVHWDSYGGLLVDLHRKLGTTYTRVPSGDRALCDHWQSIMKYDLKHWNATDMAALTEKELEVFAQFQYPIYACGYNWVRSNEHSATRLKQRILDIIGFWTQRKFDCKQVVLVTHSMGGLVARACAKQIPDKIAGVVHGVMPALGAPLAYRRIACGTENQTPNRMDDMELKGFAIIAGNTPALSTPTMATACGALELLPNHLYPSPWLFAAVRKPDGTIENVATLQHANVYDMYRDFEAWFSPISLDLADPASKYKNNKKALTRAVVLALNQAEKFHRVLLDTYYHPNSYAYYGADPNQWSFGTFRWVTSSVEASKPRARSMLPAGVGYPTFSGSRNVCIPEGGRGDGGAPIFFEPGMQDAPGDGTVSQQSGDGPRGKVKRIFRTAGYGHQGSYKNAHMLNLTHHLIVKIVQEAK